MTALVGFAGVASALDYSEVEGTEVITPQPAVSNAAAVSPAGTLPYTGSDSSLPLAEIGAGLLAAGGLTVVVVRRRQAASV